MLSYLNERLVDSFVLAIMIVPVLGAAPSLLGQDDQRQREQIGEALGKPVYRDQIRTGKNVSLPAELHRLFTAAAVNEYRRQHNEEITPTPAEIAAATKGLKTKHDERMRGQYPALCAQLKTIEEKLAAADLSEKEKAKLVIEIRTVRMIMTPPDESYASWTLKFWKFQRHLYVEFGGGRILWQQVGLEAYDATRRWYESLEKNGKFKITDPNLRSLLYEYYTTQNGSPFLTDDKERIRREFLEPKWLAEPLPQH